MSLTETWKCRNRNLAVSYSVQVTFFFYHLCFVYVEKGLIIEATFSANRAKKHGTRCSMLIQAFETVSCSFSLKSFCCTSRISTTSCVKVSGFGS